jgi:hypothetical protein
MHYPEADIDRSYVKWRGEGRSLLQIEERCTAEIISFAEYLNTRYVEDRFAIIVKSHESSQPHMNSTIKMVAIVLE